MMRVFLFLFALCSCFSVQADRLDDIREALEQSSVSQLQEKVYIHTDNQCYFVGDTLWYKAYVVQAGTLQPTYMSRLLYVELLSPDGLLVERQTIVVNPNGYTCGQFELRDSLYSGYYELRAYTRWMLNFNVRHHRYSTTDKWAFYNAQMASDFYRLWDGLYSRVFPVYSKPETPGDYDLRRMYQRPKTRIVSPKKDNLLVTFYPEGGHLLEGVPNNVAFEAVNQHGEAVNIAGTVNGGNTNLKVKTEYLGRGSFVVTPGDNRLKAHFNYKGKDYSFSLPKAEKKGVALSLKDSVLTLSTQGLAQDKQYALSVLCRGVLCHFEAIPAGKTTVQLPFAELPTGVNDVTVFNSDGQILADRLFFVNHHEQEQNVITATFDARKACAPYEKIEIPLRCEQANGPVTFSLSIRDGYTDEPTYNDGNIMTDLLLSSDLRGFIARPGYYFQSDDAERRRHLDLLMQVQGWRKYKWQELADTARRLRYAPERRLTVEGSVYRMISIDDIEPEEIPGWLTGSAFIRTKSDDPNSTEDPFADVTEDTGDGMVATEVIGVDNTPAETTSFETGTFDASTAEQRLHGGRVRHEVIVEGEVLVDGQVAGSCMKTQEGRFLFNLPAFYGSGYLNMKAYKENDSIKKNMASRKDAKIFNEDAYPDYYIKRDLFYPMFTQPYSFYQDHQPDVDEDLMLDTLSDLSMENDIIELSNVTVKGRRRGRRAIDWKKPAFVADAYEIYNNLTDWGLSYGKVDMRLFPIQVCRYLYGNMNRRHMFNVDARLDGHTFYRNYSPYAMGSEIEQASLFRANRTPQWYQDQLKLKRLQDIRVFSDYEPRKEDSTMVEAATVADATVDLVLIPNDAKQVTYRDRHIVIQGFNEAEAFYQPDYSTQKPTEPTDYRRTLYWNPNVVTDENGCYTATFYNSSKETRLRMSAAGVTLDGRLYHSVDKK